ncbi:MAG TPA: hypothetical protein VMI06_11595 [Terriglobia bacterium]|nr:hypothetical protein [Terriglobia bacterium]
MKSKANLNEVICAFRYFKDMLWRHGLRDQWYQSRQEALEEIAIE